MTGAPDIEASPLHWSFNHIAHHAADTDFKSELLEHLESCPAEPHANEPTASVKLKFRLLPNFWNGYTGKEKSRPVGARRDLACGSLVIQRSTPVEHQHTYRVNFCHDSSGEDIVARYTTAADARRTLAGAWSVHAVNHGSDHYRAVRIDGALKANAQKTVVDLAVNNRLRFASAELSPGTAITCNWSLFDCFAEMVAAAPGEFCLLENLEKLKSDCRITFLEEHVLQLKTGPLRLRGYVLHGTGAPPSYWWLRENGQVAIASNIFHTFVRSRLVDEPVEAKPVGSPAAKTPFAKITDRPNILFINTDQQTWDAISAYGNDRLKTPNIDRLVRNGVSFMRNYSTDPVCAPARACWATGRYSSETGIPFNGGALHEDIPDIGQLLNRHGYHACHAGKWHVNGRDVRDSFHSLYYGKPNIGAGGAEIYDPVSTHAVLDFLSSHQSEKPFYLQVGLLNPHDICEYEHSHEHQRIPGPLEQGFLKEAELPPLPANHTYDSRETITQQVMRRGENPIIHPRIAKAALNWSPEQWRYLRWQLDRYTEQVDLEIGLILNTLATSPHSDNTLIVFSVDHGEAAGCHRMFQKFTLYEESIRTPLIVASLTDRFGLNRGTRDTQHMTSGVDLATTILDYAGIAAPEKMRGCSLRPLLEGRETEWRDEAYVESNVWGRALVSQRYKYITEYVPQPDEQQSPGPDRTRLGREELYDLKTDPGESRNLAHEPAMQETLHDFRERLLSVESQLERRPVTTVAAQKTMRTWADRVLARWSEAET